MITLKNVSKIYRRGKKQTVAVNDINLNIAQGDIFGIIGYSGAGKSSLIRLLNRLEPVTNGEVIVGKHNITTSSEREILKIRHSIGMIFQHFNLLWSRTVRENIEFPLEISGVDRQKRHQRADELMALVGLTDKADEYPSTLSGGQKQRVGIARALANNPDVLLCDEATSALDPKTTQTILSLLAEINKKMNITIVLITHEMQVVKAICNKVAVIEQGRIIEQGDVKNVFNKPKHKVTQQFLSQTAYITDNIDDIEKIKQQGTVIRLFLQENKNFDYLFYDLVSQFNEPIKLVRGNFSQENGFIYLQLTNKSNEIIQYLKNNKFNISIL
ncbi:ATP-binding component of an ABC superfamily methionine transporter [Proteus hauseri ATCC 700826]|uniref:Cell division ATP-binding protein FtsE n=1 Tax=Proteus hauseri ATCC 700826 TaxID=1354271 RepID=A0AAJ3LU08_PROHU|nr:ATP-binding cassette domain-containing protein [Proteus hauseri]OAT47423.1 ATP-binding component of an ABC superfamily methionine transporter [Proteus hauseri ATCC 700826]